MIKPVSLNVNPETLYREETDVELRADAVSLLIEVAGPLLLHSEEREFVQKILTDLEAKLRSELKTSTAP
jgi:hypothetical protein